ncbi:glycoside hydrolase [Massarina eburnea CBS 473.64]|uniref:glucan endo-1,3-beta-D-glucosidase n=1 Tax=Massarina eburnea CBS 473.64 TaxID=1395130 RepID=A0A6A6S006_9PLEO|nr:glycoside hydrolase [Massarina eburnea CBS 473.64]
MASTTLLSTITATSVISSQLHSTSTSSSPLPAATSSTPPSSPSALTGPYAGFAYGAFWHETQAKTYADFLRQFTLAKNLPGVPVPFTSARLFQTSQWGTATEPSTAFQAAIETKTTLLLGMWIAEGVGINNELIALDTAFKKFGQQLADLVIGISVGNEDIYRSTSQCREKNNDKPCSSSFTAEQVQAYVKQARDTITKKDWYKQYFTTRSLKIGHTDTVGSAMFDTFNANLDFTGATIYPVWNNDPIENAWDSFSNSFHQVQSHAGNTPVWITETGWPSSGEAVKTAQASLANMRKYWVDVGCKTFGKNSIWWFELEKNSYDGFDWGIIDIPSQKPKIDLSCPGFDDEKAAQVSSGRKRRNGFKGMPLSTNPWVPA